MVDNFENVTIWSAFPGPGHFTNELQSQHFNFFQMVLDVILSLKLKVEQLCPSQLSALMHQLAVSLDSTALFGMLKDSLAPSINLIH